MTDGPAPDEGCDDPVVEPDELIEPERRWFALGRSSNVVVRTMWKAGVFVVGWTVIVVGIVLVLVPLPGPGWLIVFAGLAILATEFTWAKRLLRWAKARFDQAKDKAIEVKDRRQQRRPGRSRR